MGQVPGVDCHSVHRHHHRKHRRQWQGYVLLIRYRNGGMLDNRSQECAIPLERPSFRANFVSLSDRLQLRVLLMRPKSPSHSGTAIENIRRLEDGPYGGSAIHIGESLAGETAERPPCRTAKAVGAARLEDCFGSPSCSCAFHRKTVAARTATRLSNLPVAHLNQVGIGTGLGLAIISSAQRTRGPFTKRTLPTATYPALWNHDAKSEHEISLRTGLSTACKARNGESKANGTLGNCHPDAHKPRLYFRLAGFGGIYRTGINSAA